jgi:hypothetical protein
MAGFGAFQNKRLCDVVFPGTHDAGIYGDGLGATAKTQSRNIFEQAKAGVRWFDLRIATVKTKGGLKQRAYHAPALKQKTSSAGNYQRMVLNKKFAVGAGDHGGDDLSDMLQQAKIFVRDNGEEFLILRFSKCGDMGQVVNTCINVLGNARFDRNVNLNTALVSTLAGKVIIVIDEPDFNKLPTMLKVQNPGILCCKALFGDKKKGVPHAKYNPHMWGVQYFGKYSNTRKTKENIKKQLNNLADGPASSPELMGMMYWTLTTKLGDPNLFASIKKRDRKMWKGSQKGLTDAWKAGMKDHIIARAGHQHRQWLSNGYPPAAAGRSAKAFMPNIVMMDFADPNRCATIWGLNLASADAQNAMGNDLTNVGAIL